MSETKKQEDGSRLKAGMTKDPSTTQPKLHGPPPLRTQGRREPRWVTPFIRALERTGQARAAAEDAGIDFSTAYGRRRRHADFAAAWAEALERFRAAKDRAREAEVAETVARVRDGRVVSPLGPSPSQACGLGPSLSLMGRGVEGGAEEMVIRPSGTGAPKLVKASAGRWSRKREEAFLAELAASNNIRRACLAAGLSRNALHARQRKDPHFAAAWDAVVEMGKVEVRSYLAEATAQTFDPESLPDPDSSPLPKVSIAEAIKIAQLKGPPSADGPPGIEPYDVDEVRQRLEKKMRALKIIDDRDRAAGGWTQADGVWIPPGWAAPAAIRLSAEEGEPALARTCLHCGQTLYLAVERDADGDKVGETCGVIDRMPDSRRRAELD